MRVQVAEIIRQGMEQIGISVNFESLEFPDLVTRLTESYDWEAMVIGFTGSSDPFGGINFWHSSEDLHLWYPNQSKPATEWEAQIDDLYIKGSQELKP